MVMVDVAYFYTAKDHFGTHDFYRNCAGFSHESIHLHKKKHREKNPTLKGNQFVFTTNRIFRKFS